MKAKKPQELNSQILNKIPIFLSKTYKIIQNPHYQNIISWSEDGSSFIIKDVGKLTGEILPKHFKHNNLASFVRQLNMYGFHKVKSDDERNAFTHELFQKDHLQKLLQIKRKNAPSVNDLQVMNNGNSSFENNLNSNVYNNSNRNNMIVPMNGVRQNQIQKQLSQIRNKHQSLQNCVSMLVDQNKEILMQNRNFVTKMTKMQQKYRNKLQTLMLLLLFGKAKNNNGQPFILPKQFQNMLESLQQNGQFAQMQNSMNNKLNQTQKREEPLMMLKNQSQNSKKMNSPIKMHEQKDLQYEDFLDDVSGPQRMMKRQSQSHPFLQDSPYHIPPSPNHSFLNFPQSQHHQNGKDLQQFLSKLDHSDYQIQHQDK